MTIPNSANDHLPPITDAQRDEILRRSEAHRRNPGEAIPLDEALARIERELDDDPPNYTV